MNGTIFRAVRYYLGWQLALSLIALPAMLCAQGEKQVDGKTFKAYKASYFKPHRGIFYSLYATPVITVDPMGFGGTSTYGLGLGARISLWESKTPPGKYSGLKVMGLYTALAYEYYPQQHDKAYTSLWLRVNTIIPLVARADLVYSTGYGLQGISYRYCFGIEVKRIALLFCGEVLGSLFGKMGPHPWTESPYSNAGSILLVIPFYERKDK